MGLLDPPGLSKTAADARYAFRKSAATRLVVQAGPRLLTSPPTTTLGVSGAASAITSAITVSVFEPGAFQFLGGPVAQTTSIAGFGATMGTYPGTKTSPAPTIVDFVLDTVDPTGRFEIYWSGSPNKKVRVAIRQPDGSWGHVTTDATFVHSSSGQYRDLVTLGAPGVYQLRLEFDYAATFYGLTVAPTDSVTAGPGRPRYIVVGDSFTEPTITDTGASMTPDGWPIQLGYMTGLDVWCAGAGGTGWMNPNSAGNRVKFRDRIAQDVSPFSPDGIIWAGGINDFGTYTAAQIGSEALACLQAAQAAGVNDQIVLSPFFSIALAGTYRPNILAVSDALAAAAAAVGATYLNLLELPDEQPYLAKWQGTTWPGTVLAASAAQGASSISVPDVPTYMKIGSATKSGWYVRFGSGTNHEIRQISGMVGSGPYQLNFNSGLGVAHAAGEPVSLSGPSYMTGSGKQTALTGTGNADRYTGSDSTHPTKAGHAHIARSVAALCSRASQRRTGTGY